MNAPSASSTLANPKLSTTDQLRAEAAIEPDPVHRAAEERDPGHRDLRQGRHRQELHPGQPQLHDGPAGQARAADRLRPQERHDLPPVRRPQLPDHHRDLLRKKLAGEKVEIGDVCFIRDGVFAMELGGPEVGRGCGGRGIIHGFELLEKLGFHEWGFDYVLLDFLGDVVCGGFGLPIARDMCQKVIVVGSNDLQSLYVANNVCSAVDYFRKMGGNVGVAGMVINKDDGTGEAKAFAETVGIPVLAAIPADEDIRRKSANYEIIGIPGGRWAPMFEELATQVGHGTAGAAEPAEPGHPPRAVQRRDRLAGTSSCSRRRWPTCAARPSSRSRRWKSSTRVPPEGGARDGLHRPSRQGTPAGGRQPAAPGCHGGKETMLEAAKAAGKSEMLEKLAADYPRGRTTSRSPCARPSARCASACGCAARRRSSRARPAASTA